MASTASPSTLETCLSPALLHLYDTAGKVVVIIDVFRATSTIAAALHNGAARVVPVATVEECIALGAGVADGITAGERNGQVAPGLKYGNSPSEYPGEFIRGKTLFLTTTNGTRLLHMVQDAADIVTGAFLNLSAVCDYLLHSGKSVLLGCAAWKDRFNLEDTLFAGAVAEHLIAGGLYSNCDSTRAAMALHGQSGGDYLAYLRDSSHYRRLSAYGLEADMAYCATPDLHPVVPVLRGTDLVRA